MAGQAPERGRPGQRTKGRVLVTGGAGYVGAILVGRLLERGHAVRVLDNLMYGGDSLLRFFLDPRFELVRGSVTDPSAIDAALRDVDLVVHLAAIVGFPACRKRPELATEVNVGGTRRLAERTPRDVPILYASTGSNYGAIEGGPCTEDTPLSPQSHYAATKAEAERVLLDRGRVVPLRFATGFGLSTRLRLDLLVNDFVFQALKQRNLVVYEKDHMRSFLHVRDMADAFVFAAERRDAMMDRVYNVGSESLNYTKAQICQLLRRKIDFFLHYADSGRDEDRRDYAVSYERIRAAGFTPRVTLEQGVDELCAGLGAIDIPNPYANA